MRFLQEKFVLFFSYFQSSLSSGTELNRGVFKMLAAICLVKRDRTSGTLHCFELLSIKSESIH